MDNNLIEFAKLIFTDEPKAPYSIQMELDEYDSLEQIFEILLHIFIYGVKIKNLNFNNLYELKPYFKSIGADFDLKKIEYSEIEYLTNPKYLKRYCIISSYTFTDQDLNNVSFIQSANYKTVDNLEDIYACYSHQTYNDIENSFIFFLNFNFKIF
jgi:hypothetical protein